MGLFTLFDSKRTAKEVNKITSHFANLIALAKIDGHISDSEYELIYSIGEKHNLKSEDIDFLIDNSTNTEFILPTNDSERFDQIFDLVQLMLTDNVIDEAEIDFCIDIAEKLGFRKAIVGVLVRKISVGLISGKDKEDLKEEAKNFLKF